MNGRLSMRSVDCLWQWLLRKVYSYEGVRVTGGLTRVFAPYIRIAKINSALSACRNSLIEIGFLTIGLFTSLFGSLL
jgi:hypothetical protein